MGIGHGTARRALGIATALVLAAAPGTASAAGVTNAGGDARTGWFSDQPQLRPGATFGRLWDRPVTGQVYAEPLVVGTRVVIATERNRVTVLDLATGRPQWTTVLARPWNPGELDCADLTPSIGVTATPVVDETAGTIYLTHKTYAATGQALWSLDALDLATGRQRDGFPVRLDGVADNDPSRRFDPRMQLQRPGLLLLDGVVYAAFGSHCGTSPYQGWVFGVSTAGQVRARWVANTHGDGSGIWQAGAGLMSDGPGRLFVATGNGFSPPAPLAGTADTGGRNGGSVVRLEVQPDGTLRAADFFAPFDAAFKDLFNGDFSSGGVVALPRQPFGSDATPNVAVAAGKPGYVYLLDRDHLGGIAQAPDGGDDVLDRAGPIGAVFGRVGAWPGDGGYLYVPTATDDITWVPRQGHLRVLAAVHGDDGRPGLRLAGAAAGPFGFGSGAVVVTSDGLRSGSALVWTVWSPDGTGAGGELRAYDPVPVDGLLHLRFRDAIGTASKFSTPGVGGGRVLVGTRDGHVLAYGPLGPPVAARLRVARPARAPDGRRLIVSGALTRRAQGAVTITVRARGGRAVVVHARISAGRFRRTVRPPAGRRLRVTVRWPGSATVRAQTQSRAVPSGR